MTLRAAAAGAWRGTTCTWSSTRWRARIEQEASYAPKLLRELCVDGLIVFHVHAVPEAVQALIRKQGITATWLHQEGEVDCVHGATVTAAPGRARSVLNAAGRTRYALG